MDSPHDPALFYLCLPKVEHVRSNPNCSTKGIQQQVHHLESPPRGEDLVTFIRIGIKQREVEDREELPVCEITPPQQRPRQQVSQDGVLEEMGQPAEVKE